MELFEANCSTIGRLRAHPLALGFGDSDRGVDFTVYTHHGKAAVVEAAPLFASITLRAPSADISDEAYRRFRQFFVDLQSYFGDHGHQGRTGPDPLPTAVELGRFMASLAKSQPYCGEAALAAVFEVMCEPINTGASDGKSARSAQRELLMTGHDAPAKGVLELARAIVDLTPADDREEVATVYGRALEHLDDFWTECWAQLPSGL